MAEVGYHHFMVHAASLGSGLIQIQKAMMVARAMALAQGIAADPL
jgi:hypothetical protein